MPSDLIRDSFFGHCCRLLTGGAVFQYPEEKDPTYWLRYINVDKSRHMARHGRPTAPPLDSDDDDVERKKEAVVVKETSDGAIIESSTRADGDVDGDDGETGGSFRGREEKIVDWDGPDDPEVSDPTGYPTTIPHGERLIVMIPRTSNTNTR